MPKITRVFRWVATRLVPLLVLATAVFWGWLITFPIPEGTLFSMLYPVTKGYLPTVLSGGFKVTPVPLLVVPDDVTSTDMSSYNGGLVRLPRGGADKDAWMPQQGIGMCCRHTAYDPESVRRTILWYLFLGGRHIDTADLYQNHQWIGEALQIAIHKWKIPRDEIWVTTKLWPLHYGYNATAEAIPRMLKELQLDYVDLVLMHQPSLILSKFRKSECSTLGLSPKECRLETWKALGLLRQRDLVRHVGVSNFNPRQMQEIRSLDGSAPIANNQFQYNPWMPDHAHETFEYCMQNDISVTAWSSFSGSTMQHMQAFSIDLLQEIARVHSVTVAQVLLKWAMQMGAIVIPGSGNPKHIAENIHAYKFNLTDQEMKGISDLRNDESAKKFFAGPPDDS